MARVDLALIHNQVYNKEGVLVTTCITGFDLHDIARTCKTYGLGYYVVNEMPAQQAFTERVLSFWRNESGKSYNETRAHAMASVSLKSTLNEVIATIQAETGKSPYLVATSARQGAISYAALKEKLTTDSHPYLLLFGTGWGLSQEMLSQTNWVLEPILGPTDYNHLSVRSAVAITLDRLFGKRKGEEAYVYS